MPRYRVAYIDPKTGRERLGTGGDAQFYCEYASVKNVIRFGLDKPGCPAGQYNIYLAPEGTFNETFVQTAYKRAERRQLAKGCTACKEYESRARLTMNWLFPYHDPADKCQSGHRNHCSCDICF